MFPFPVENNLFLLSTLSTARRWFADHSVVFRSLVLILDEVYSTCPIIGRCML